MSDTSGFSNLVPGFEFLQSLVKNAGAALPGVGQWVAPTLDPQEIDKRIGELRTVQFWLEQNAKMLSATIQALEVQRMTLSTLKTMNVQMADLRESLQIKLPEQPEAPPASAPSARQPAAGAGESAEQPAGPAAATAPVDPMQWWGALTQQFTELATNALQQGAQGGLAAAMGRSTIDGVNAGGHPGAAPATKRSARKSAAKGKRSPSGSKKAKGH